MKNELTGGLIVIQNALWASKLSKKIGNRLSMHGVSFTEYLVMHYLDSLPDKVAPRIELADYLAMSASGVTRLIAPMIKIGLIDKIANPRDARHSLVKLSKVGSRLLSETRITFEQVTEEVLSALSTNEQKKFVELFLKVI